MDFVMNWNNWNYSFKLKCINNTSIKKSVISGIPRSEAPFQSLWVKIGHNFAAKNTDNIFTHIFKLSSLPAFFTSTLAES